jgi:excisionase family DNA binding protein
VSRSTPPASRRVSIADAAAYVPCSTKTIRRRVASGELRAVRFGRKLLVDLDEIDRLLKPVPTVGQAS